MNKAGAYTTKNISIKLMLKIARSTRFIAKFYGHGEKRIDLNRLCKLYK